MIIILLELISLKKLLKKVNDQKINYIFVKNCDFLIILLLFCSNLNLFVVFHRFNGWKGIDPFFYIFIIYNVINGVKD